MHATYKISQLTRSLFVVGGTVVYSRGVGGAGGGGVRRGGAVLAALVLAVLLVPLLQHARSQRCPASM